MIDPAVRTAPRYMALADVADADARVRTILALHKPSEPDRARNRQCLGCGYGQFPCPDVSAAWEWQCQRGTAPLWMQLAYWWRRRR